MYRKLFLFKHFKAIIIGFFCPFPFERRLNAFSEVRLRTDGGGGQ